MHNTFKQWAKKPQTHLITLALLFGISVPALAMTSQDIDQHWNYALPANSEQAFATLAAHHEKDLPLYLEILTQKARAQGLQEHYKEAHETLDLVRQANQTNAPIVTIRYLLERGRVLNSSGHPEDALVLFQSALDEAEQHHLDYYAIDAAHMLGIASGPREQKLWTLAAIDMAEKSRQKRSKVWLGSLYNNLGWSHFDNQDYDLALKIFQKNVAWYQQYYPKGMRAIIAQWSVARTYRALGEYETALKQQKHLSDEMTRQQLGENGYISEEIAENLLALNQPIEAQVYFKQAWQLLSQDLWLQKNEPQRLSRLKQLATSSKERN